MSAKCALIARFEDGTIVFVTHPMDATVISTYDDPAKAAAVAQQLATERKMPIAVVPVFLS